MSKDSRVYFGHTYAFFDLLKSLQLAGKRVILANLNELNAALLEAIGVNRYALLGRRKSTSNSPRPARGFARKAPPTPCYQPRDELRSPAIPRHDHPQR